MVQFTVYVCSRISCSDPNTRFVSLIRVIITSNLLFQWFIQLADGVSPFTFQLQVHKQLAAHVNMLSFIFILAGLLGVLKSAGKFSKGRMIEAIFMC